MTIRQLRDLCDYLCKKYHPDNPIYMEITDQNGNVTVDRILDAYVTTEGRLQLKNTHINRKKSKEKRFNEKIRSFEHESG